MSASNEKEAVPAASLESPAASANGNGNGDIDPSQVTCPPHTTERRLLWKIDAHVVPFLCIMYLWAFLGMFQRLVLFRVDQD